jgi:site-specific DNA recombinase
LLFDADGNRMTPTHAVKKGRRYRYYVSHPLITQARAGSPGGLRVPAPEIEQLVANRLCQFLSEPDSILEATEQLGLDPASQQHLIDRAAQIAGSWSTLPSSQMRALLTPLIQQIEVRPERVDLQILPARLAPVLGTAPAILGSADQEDANVLTLSVAAQLRRTGR